MLPSVSAFLTWSGLHTCIYTILSTFLGCRGFAWKKNIGLLCNFVLNGLNVCVCVGFAGVDWKAVRDFVDASDSLHEFAHPEGFAQPNDG